MSAPTARQQLDARPCARRLPLALLWVAACYLSPVALAQESAAGADPHAGHDSMAPMTSPSTPGSMSATDSAKSAGKPAGGAKQMGAMQGGSAPPDARDPNAYSDGYDFGPYDLKMMDKNALASLRMDELETVRGQDNNFTAYDLQAWFGRTFNRAVLKSEGDIDSGELAEARSELLWGHAVATYWDTELGLRYDHGQGPNRTWLAFGVQGLAPYWFDVQLTGYVGEQGRGALRLDTEYEVLFTQRLILVPRVETNIYSKDDTRRGLGKGLSDITAGLRLRYEIRREFAPYVGVEWAGKFGETQDLAKAAGENIHDTRVVAGLRFWF